jgi:hypothetical protein
VPRTLERQFARAFVFASHSKDAGSPRADTGDTAQLLAPDAGPNGVDKATAVATNKAVKRGTIIKSQLR